MVKFAKKISILIVVLLSTISFCAFVGKSFLGDNFVFANSKLSLGAQQNLVADKLDDSQNATKILNTTTRVEMVYNDDDSIVQNFYVTVFKGGFEEDYAAMQSCIISALQEELQRQKTSFVLEPNNLIYRNDIKILQTQLLDDEQTFVAALWFKEQKIFNKFYNLSTKNSAELKQEKHFFYTKVFQTGYTILSNPKLEQIYYLVVSNVLTNPLFEGVENHNEIRYTMIADTKREHSNADIIEQKDGKFYHTWIFTDIQQTITVYFIMANRANWILVCLGVGLLVCAVLCVVAVIVVKKRKRKKNESQSS